MSNKGELLFDKRTNGFSLIELLVSLSIITLLCVLAFPAFRAVDEKGKNVKCISNLKALGTSTLVYLQDNNNTLPVFSTTNSNWVSAISPYLPVPPLAFSVSKKSILLCPKAYSLASKPISSGSATTYGINERVSGINFNLIRRPSQTALFTDTSTPWAISVRIDRQPSLIHGSTKAAMVLYGDFHIDGVTSIDAWSSSFWKPDAE